MKQLSMAILTLLLYSVSSSTKLSAQENKKFLTVISYNILNGFNFGKDTPRETKVVKWIKSRNPDVLALQELCGFNQDKLEELAKKWGHNHALILKKDGYPVGITSKQPIVLKERLLEKMWHGMLHVETYGIDFFVVHMSPGRLAIRQKEVGLITDRIKQLPQDSQCIVLGDFNSHSPFDGDFDRKYPYQLERARRGGANKNLLNNEFDYGVMATFLSLPLIDICQRYVPLDLRTTQPTPLNVPKWLTAEEIKKTKHRIDFILASPNLAIKCIGANIFNGEETAYLSDHYPVEATFMLD